MHGWAFSIGQSVVGLWRTNVGAIVILFYPNFLPEKLCEQLILIVGAQHDLNSGSSDLEPGALVIDPSRYPYPMWMIT